MVENGKPASGRGWGILDRRVGGRENQNRGKKVKTGVTAVEYRKRNNRSRSRESRPAWSTLQNLLVLRQSKLERFLLPFIVSPV